MTDNGSRATNDPRERQHQETRPGVESWWRCVPLETARQWEREAAAAAVREADALREALRDAAMSYHTVKEHSRKFSECDWASCRMWRAALSATEPAAGEREP